MPICGKCGDNIDEGVDLHEHLGDKAICRECILDVIEQADDMGMILWAEEFKEITDCYRDIPIPLRGKTNACLMGGPRTEENPGGQFCEYLESVGECKFDKEGS